MGLAFLNYYYYYYYYYYCYFSGQSVVVDVKLEREDDEQVSPFVIAPFFPQVSHM